MKTFVLLEKKPAGKQALGRLDWTPLICQNQNQNQDQKFVLMLEEMAYVVTVQRHRDKYNIKSAEKTQCEIHAIYTNAGYKYYRYITYSYASIVFTIQD